MLKIEVHTFKFNITLNFRGCSIPSLERSPEWVQTKDCYYLRYHPLWLYMTTGDTLRHGANFISYFQIKDHLCLQTRRPSMLRCRRIGEILQNVSILLAFLEVGWYQIPQCKQWRVCLLSNPNQYLSTAAYQIDQGAKGNLEKSIYLAKAFSKLRLTGLNPIPGGLWTSHSVGGWYNFASPCISRQLLG